MNNKQKNYNNQRNHEEILLNNEYFDKNQKKETQKQLNLRNSNKTRNLEKSYPFSRELKIKKGEDDIFIGQNDKNGEENSNNTSVNKNYKAL